MSGFTGLKSVSKRQKNLLIIACSGLTAISLVVGFIFSGGFSSPNPTRTEPVKAVDSMPLRTCSLPKLTRQKPLGEPTIVVTNASTGETLFSKNAVDALPMGSVMKLVTAAAAIQELGPTGTLKTTVVDGTEEGTVYLVGGGDPTLSAGKATVYPGAPTIVDLAEQTVSSYQQRHPGIGISHVVVDLSLFPAEDAWHPSWPTTELTSGYQPKIVPLMIDGDRQNPGSMTSPRSEDPAGKAAQAFLEELQAAGNESPEISISYATAPTNATILGQVESQPISTLIGQMIPYSDNTLAEMLARTVSVASGRDGSASSIQPAFEEALNKAGITIDGATFVDGSGESKEDLLPAAGIVKLITAIFTGENNLNLLRDSLPVAGVSGTLASRFTGKAAAAQTHVTAKTGWIEGVYALAGRIDSIDGTPLDFVVVARGEGLTSTSMEAIDILVNGFYGCGNNLASY